MSDEDSTGSSTSSAVTEDGSIKVEVRGRVGGHGEATVLVDPLDRREFALAYPGENPPLLATVTGAKGRWAIADVPQGRYRVSATRIGQGADSVIVDVEADNGLAIDLDPRPTPFQLRGAITRPDGTAVSGAWLVYRPHGVHSVARAIKSDAKGDFELGASRTWAGDTEFEIHASGLERHWGGGPWISSRKQPYIEAAPGRLVRGHVRAPGGERLAGATVEGAGLMSATGDDGTFVIGPFASSDPVLLVARSREAVGAFGLDFDDLHDADDVQVEIQTVPAVAVQGRAVTDAGQPLPDAVVRLVDLRMGLASEATASAEGTFEVWGVVPGPHRASWPSLSWGPHFGSMVEVTAKTKLEVRRPDGLETRRLEVQLDPPAEATVEVTLQAERAYAANSMAVGAMLVRTGPDGRAVVDVLPDAYEVTIVADDGRGARQTVTVGDALRTVIPLQARSSITGRVVDEKKRALAGAAVVVRWDNDDLDTDEPWTTARTDPDGAFSVPGLERGRYELTVEIGGATLPFVGANGDDVAPRREVKVGKGPGRPVTLDVDTKTHVLTASALGPDGQPLQGAEISVDAFAIGRRMTMATDERGEARFNVLSARYQMTAQLEQKSTHTRLEPDTQRVEFRFAGEPNRVSAPLWPHTVSLLLDGKPYTGLVVARGRDGRENYKVVTAQDSVVMGMQWQNVLVTPAGAVNASLNPTDGETTTLELHRWATAQFTAVDEAGHPLRNVALEVVSGAAGFDMVKARPAYEIITDDAGRARAPYLVLDAEGLEIKLSGEYSGYRIKAGVLKAGETVELGKVELKH